MIDARESLHAGLVRRWKDQPRKSFVHSIFSEEYKTSIRVKIDKKSVTLGGQVVELILWDAHGDDEFQRVRQPYVKGAAGCLFVVDGTHWATWDDALNLGRKVTDWIGEILCLLLLNKADLVQTWELDTDALASETGVRKILRTSAKSGEGVDEAFRTLARLLLVPAGP